VRVGAAERQAVGRPEGELGRVSTTEE